MNDFSDVAIITGHEFESQQPKQVAAIEIESQRAVQEVQGAMIVAKRFPRDQFSSYNRIMEACKRPSLAAAAQYAYPRGGTMITGPTIRLAEVLANAWGNIQSGIIELSRSNGASEVMAYAWDLETNTRKVMQFQVRHVRDTKGGGKALEGERDIYELIANQGARRLRACILSVIPGDIVEAAEKKCEETLKKGGEPLEDRIRKMVTAFAEFGVTTEMIEKRLQHKMSATIIQELVTLGRIYTSLKDGMAKRDDFFDLSVSGEPVTQQDAPDSEKQKRHRRTKLEMEQDRQASAPERTIPIVRDEELIKTNCPVTQEIVYPPSCSEGCQDAQGCTVLKDYFEG